MAKNKFKKVEIPKCSWHTRTGYQSYLQAFEDAEARLKRGEEQVRCAVCGYYYWPDEFGVDPVSKIITNEG